MRTRHVALGPGYLRDCAALGSFQKPFRATSFHLVPMTSLGIRHGSLYYPILQMRNVRNGEFMSSRKII